MVSIKKNILPFPKKVLTEMLELLTHSLCHKDVLHFAGSKRNLKTNYLFWS